MGNKSTTYLNLLPKEIRLKIADKLDVYHFLDFSEYIKDVIDADYINLLKGYTLFEQFRHLIKYFPELIKCYTWREIYLCSRINMDRMTIALIDDGNIINRCMLLTSTFFMFTIERNYPTFYDEMISICSTYGHGLHSWAMLGLELMRVCTINCTLFHQLVSDSLSGQFPTSNNITYNEYLIYYLVGRRNSKMKWPALLNTNYYTHFLFFNKLFQLMTTNWIENIDEYMLLMLYEKLRNIDDPMVYDKLKHNFRRDAISLIEFELKRRGKFDR